MDSNNIIKRLCLSLCLSVMLSSVSLAEVITYDFSGRLDGILDNFNLAGGQFFIGDEFSGTFSYTTTASEGITSIGDPTFSIYSAILSYGVEINGHSFQTDGSAPKGFLQVWDGRTVGLSTVDAFTVSSPIIFNVPIDIGPGRIVSQGTVFLFDFTNTVYSNTLIPSFVNLSDFGSRQFRVLELNLDTNRSFHLTGTVTSLTRAPNSTPEPSTPIPAPASLALFIFGLSALGFVRRRHNA